MGARNPEKELLKQKISFETVVKLCENAIKSDKSTCKRLMNLDNDLKSSYFLLAEAFQFYKSDVIARDCKTEEAFNGKDDDGNDSFVHNDTWADARMAKYIEITETLEEKIDAFEQPSTPKNIEQNVIEPKLEPKVDVICSEIESEKSVLTQSVESFVKEVDKAEKISATRAQALDKFASSLKARLDSLGKKSLYCEEVDFRTGVLEFCKAESTKVDESVLKICMKLDEEVSMSTTAGAVAKPAKEQVYLEKSKPPKFKGDEVDYPEFKRKWLSIVSKANLPEESEIDKLRDAIPVDAKDLLYGVKSMDESWKILDKRFGDSRIIAMKLKSQLKAIKSEGKTDPEKIINLVIKVRTISTKLEAIKHKESLLHDNEFLSAVYYALPAIDQRRWLETKKGDCHWTTMIKFLDDAYERATEELSLLSTYKPQGKDTKTPPTKAFGTVVQPDDDEKKAKARKKSEEFCGKCPTCNKSHTWTRNDGEKWPSDRLISCRKFNDMSVSDKAKEVEKCKGCPRCTSWNHTRDKCKMPSNKCGKENSAGVKCKGDHSKVLCGSGNAYCYAVKSFKSKGMSKSTLPNVEVDKDIEAACADFGVDENVETVLYFQDIEVEGPGRSAKARTFWDRGSNRVLVRQEFGERLGLMKKRCIFSIETVGAEEELEGYIYLLVLRDMNGHPHKIWGYSVDRIMLSSTPDMTKLAKLFPHVSKKAFTALVEKEVDILVGVNMTRIFPEGGLGDDKREGISIQRSLFSNGWVVGGVMPDGIKPNPCALSAMAAKVRCARVKIIPEAPILPDFWECDQLGVSVPAKCNRCKRCQETGECSEEFRNLTLKQQAELDLIKENTKLINGEIWCTYPYIKDPSCLANNRQSAVKVAEKVYNSLKKDNLLEAYNKQVREILDRKAAVKLTKQEIDEYEGPHQYISHHAVLKDSISTPVRMVTNSSFNNGGQSLNSCLAAGPNSLNPMLSVLLRFRCWECAMQYDLKKAYNTMHTGVMERHLRRWVWKFDDDADWEDYAFDKVHFGDCPAATILEVSKDLSADAGEYIDKEAAERIRRDIYVDDGLTGGKKQQVARFMGEKDAEGNFNGTIPPQPFIEVKNVTPFDKLDS